jgi:hypothetical protein
MTAIPPVTLTPSSQSENFSLEERSFEQVYAEVVNFFNLQKQKPTPPSTPIPNPTSLEVSSSSPMKVQTASSNILGKRKERSDMRIKCLKNSIQQLESIQWGLRRQLELEKLLRQEVPPEIRLRYKAEKWDREFDTSGHIEIMQVNAQTITALDAQEILETHSSSKTIT